MKITAIRLYAVDLPMKEGAYSWSTQSFSAFDSTIVAVETDEGLVGYGEICPLGPAYLPAYAELVVSMTGWIWRSRAIHMSNLPSTLLVGI